MVKKRNTTAAASSTREGAAASSTREGAAAKSSSSLPKGSVPTAPPPAPAPPAPSGSTVRPGDWVASTVTKRDEKRSRSLGLISPDAGDVILPGPKDETRINDADLSEKELLDEVRRLTSFNQEDSIPLISSYAPFDVDHPPAGILMPSENTHDSPDDTSEGKDSSIPVDFHTMDQTAADGAKASPAKRSTGGFADEDDLFDIDEGFVEPPSKKAKSDAVSPVVVASEASAPRAAPTAQASTASSLSKGKDISPTAAAAAPFSDLRGVISSLEVFASQFTSLEADKVRLQKEVESSSSKLDGAVKIAAAAHQEIYSLKEELAKLKGKLKEEEASRLVAEARATEKDEVLRQSSLALLEAANIPVDTLERVPNNSPANAVSTILASHQLTQELLVQGDTSPT
ncbi:hypothetical protein QYE76_041963 [Lolium multiflorum]|uniref:Uncharacterized protein n=1 Tax=Lolium multiflorum TaxID=4521 RepID=A0AAD8TEI6_LOLMU|nr:hypothetical protein QYE76_041963 [Lolium multiflorum]